jgi:hypothetical protein
LGPKLFSLNPFLSSGGIFLSGTSLLDNIKLSLLNVYGPCQERKDFWNSLDTSGLLAHKDLIIVGDMNFTTSMDEVWGNSAQGDPMAGYFKYLFIKHSLVDVAPDRDVPTWRNGRSGQESIAKRLDRFYVAEDLLASILRHRSWVEFPFLSDHAPVLLEFGVGIPAVAYPFKFNSGWMNDDSFAGMVRKFGMTLVFILLTMHKETG